MLCRTRTSFSVKVLNRRKSEYKGDERERDKGLGTQQSGKKKQLQDKHKNKM